MEREDATCFKEPEMTSASDEEAWLLFKFPKTLSLGSMLRRCFLPSNTYTCSAFSTKTENILVRHAHGFRPLSQMLGQPNPSQVISNCSHRASQRALVPGVMLQPSTSIYPRRSSRGMATVVLLIGGLLGSFYTSFFMGRLRLEVLAMRRRWGMWFLRWPDC